MNRPGSTGGPARFPGRRPAKARRGTPAGSATAPNGLAADGRFGFALTE